jgi:hypothetical protein
MGHIAQKKLDLNFRVTAWQYRRFAFLCESRMLGTNRVNQLI